MGGIAAAMTKDGAPATAVSRMLRAAPHRGVERGVIHLGDVALGVSSHPDATDIDIEQADGLACAFAGSLDNADELGKGLEHDGVHPTSMGPAGLILEIVRRAPLEAQAALRGRFAVAVTDGRTLSFFRDHIGFETLFWREDAGGRFVASEMKQVLAGAKATPEPDVDVLEAIFYADLEDHALCSLKGVRRAICGNLYEADHRGVRRRRYWHPERLLETVRLSDDAIAERFRELMQQAVSRTLTGEDAVALSGGLDSPAVAAFAVTAEQGRTGRPLQALSAYYAGYPVADESRYIQALADAFGMPLHAYEPAPQRLDRLEEWVTLFDGPWSIWSPAGADEQFRIARELGIRTILTGEMAEQVSAMQFGVVPHLLSHARLGAAARFLRMERAQGRGWRALAKEVAWTGVPRWVMARKMRDRPLIAIPEWIDAERAGRARSRSALPGRRYWRAGQLGAFGDGSSLSLEASSIIQARDGVRIRMPWADVDLWEFFVSLRAEAKFPEPRMKSLERRLLRGSVPDIVLDRTDKTVMNDWFEDTSLDYPSLRRWLVDPVFRMPGVDYERLARSLESEDMRLDAYIWAKDLAGTHAFLSRW